MDLDEHVRADQSSSVDVELAVTLLVDRRGWVLLQERDEHALVAQPKR